MFIKSTRAVFIAVFGVIAAAPAKATEPCVFPSADVFAFVCANTSNNSDGSVLSVDDAGNLSSQIGSNLFGVTTTNLGNVKPGTAIIASNYGLGGSKNGAHDIVQGTLSHDYVFWIAPFKVDVLQNRNYGGGIR
jgi:hypothetical protein